MENFSGTNSIVVQELVELLEQCDCLAEVYFRDADDNCTAITYVVQIHNTEVLTDTGRGWKPTVYLSAHG